MTKDKNILINNVYHMLAYAFQTLNQEQYEDLATESFDEMYDLLAASIPFIPVICTRFLPMLRMRIILSKMSLMRWLE